MGAFLEHPVTSLVLAGIIWAVAMTGALSRKMAFVLFVVSDAVGVYGIQHSASYSLTQRCLFSAMLTIAVGLLAWWSFVKGANVRLDATLAIQNVIRSRSAGHPDIFIQASAHLRSPNSADVKYVADLIRNGVTTHSELIEDIDLWGIVERKQLDLAVVKLDLGVSSGVIPEGGFSRNVQPLPSALSAMRKSDGWLHFRVANLSDLDITESLLRLTVTSPNAMEFTERDLKGTISGPLNFVRKMRV
jgi:hypothetical protein